MNRRRFLQTAGAGALIAGTGLTFAQASPRRLPILPLTDLMGGIEARIPLMLAPSRHDFGNGTMSDTYGIDADYLGPLIRAKQGQTLPFDVTNGVEHGASIHWHGLHIPGDVDADRTKKSSPARRGPPTSPSSSMPR